MEMLRTTVRGTSRSFRMSGQGSEEDGASSRVHLRLKIRFYVESTSEEVRGATYLGEEMSRFSMNLSSLENREEISHQILQHLSSSTFELLLLFIDDIRMALSEMLLEVARQSDLRANDSLLLASTMHVTCHVGEAEAREYQAAIDLLELARHDSLSEPAQCPASRASVDALERKKMEDHDEESGQIVCVDCQDEVGRGESIVKMPCSHEFHEDCILAWLQRAHSCPVCRFQLPTND